MGYESLVEKLILTISRQCILKAIRLVMEVNSYQVNSKTFKDIRMACLAPKVERIQPHGKFP